MYYGTGACFLQDADNLVMTTKDLVEVLGFLRQNVPGNHPRDHLLPLADGHPKIG